MRLRLLADDLTGALDTAAQFVARTGPVPAFWAGALPDAPPPSAARTPSHCSPLGPLSFCIRHDHLKGSDLNSQ